MVLYICNFHQSLLLSNGLNFGTFCYYGGICFKMSTACTVEEVNSYLQCSTRPSSDKMPQIWRQYAFQDPLFVFPGGTGWSVTANNGGGCMGTIKTKLQKSENALVSISHSTGQSLSSFVMQKNAPLLHCTVGGTSCGQKSWFVCGKMLAVVCVQVGQTRPAQWIQMAFIRLYILLRPTTLTERVCFNTNGQRLIINHPC